MDEKQKEIVTSAMAKVLAIVYIVILVIGITKLIACRSIFGCLLELIFIAAVPILVYLFARSRKKVSFPMSIAGQEVRPDGTKNALIGRIRAYILDSLQSSSVIALFIGISDIWQAYRAGSLTGLGDWFDAIGSILLQFIAFFIVFFAFNYFIYEYRAKKAREYLLQKEKRAKAYQAMTGRNDQNE